MTEFHDAARVELDEVAAKITLMDDRFKSPPPLPEKWMIYRAICPR